MAVPSAAAGKESRAPERPERPLDVLLAEDCALNALVGNTLLEQLGHRVTHVSGGTDAIDAFERQDFDIVLLDLELPDIGGLEVAQRIRAVRSPKYVPILAVSGLVNPERVAAMSAHGIDGYIEKPLRIAPLRVMLARLMSPEAGNPASLRPSLDPPVDGEALLQEVGGDRELLCRMLQIFREQTAKLVVELGVGIRSKDAQRIGAAAHALKGVIANFKLGGAYHSAANLEASSRSGQTVVPAEYDRLMTELGALRRELSALEGSLERP
jgi:two-component system, sensor histidine kinase and response regulator